jgi:hypothetical protein
MLAEFEQNVSWILYAMCFECLLGLIRNVSGAPRGSYAQCFLNASGVLCAMFLECF